MKKISKNKKKPRILEDVKINVKIKLSLLWVAVMFFYVYADIKSLFKTGVLEDIIKGQILGMQINQFFLMSSAILMSIPAIMIFLSLILKPQVSRILNIVFASIFTFTIIGTYFMPGKVWYYSIYYSTLECIFNFLIIWFAWKWPILKNNKGETQ